MRFTPELAAELARQPDPVAWLANKIKEFIDQSILDEILKAAELEEIIEDLEDDQRGMYLTPTQRAAIQREININLTKTVNNIAVKYIN